MIFNTQKWLEKIVSMISNKCSLVSSVVLKDTHIDLRSIIPTRNEHYEAYFIQFINTGAFSSAIGE